MTDPEKSKGLNRNKYNVQSAGHEKCDWFVLDGVHDKFSRVALSVYKMMHVLPPSSPVQRTDGSSSLGGKHERCIFHTLDLDHDPMASVAMLAYADACEHEYPQLALDLRERVIYRDPPSTILLYLTSVNRRVSLVPDERCPECGGDLGGNQIGRIENHIGNCSLLPL